MVQSWRYIPLLEASGEVQMSVDRWLLARHRQGYHPPSLRFYTWYPAAISLGYHQRHYPQAWQNLTWQGEKIDVVRRPTGGRAVLHQGDLTYALVTSGLEGNVYQVYQNICSFLIAGWQRLGVSLEYGQAGGSYIGKANCFALGTAADLVNCLGHKLIGSAQLRQGKAILQHGSMLLDVNQDLFGEVFGELPPPRINFPFAVNTPNGQEQIIQALLAAAQDCFQVEFFLEPLSCEEWDSIHSYVI